MGIDWKFKQIYRMQEKIGKRQIQNLLALRANQERIEHVFGPEEVTGFFLFFPDPWPKAHHHKHRIFQKPWLEQVHRALAPNGTLEVKTDHREYFEQMIDVARSCTELFSIEFESWDLHQANPDASRLQIPAVTLFERLFIKDGLPIHKVFLRKLLHNRGLSAN